MRRRPVEKKRTVVTVSAQQKVIWGEMRQEKEGGRKKEGERERESSPKTKEEKREK